MSSLVSGLNPGPSATLASGPQYNSDLSKTGPGLARGPNVGKRNLEAGWAQTWPAPGATLDLDFANDRGFVRGVGQGKSMDAVTFTRASSGTYINAAGQLAYSGGFGLNLSAFPQNFDNAAWTKSNCSVTPNSGIAPDGTNTAYSLYESTTNTTHVIATTVSGAASVPVVTSSIYLKANNRKIAYFGAGGGLPQQVQINLTTGAVLNTPSVTYSVLNAGNGWWRVSVTTSYSPVAGIALYICNDAGATTYTGDGTSGILIWGAQVELGSILSKYFPTNLNTPRFDWASTTQIGIRNLLSSTVVLTNASYWNGIQVSVAAANSITDPFGGNSAYLISEVAVSSIHYWKQSISLTKGNQYVASVYVQYNGRQWVDFQIESQYCYFDLINGVVGNSSGGTGTITNVGGGWWRITFVTTAIGGAQNWNILGASANGTSSYLGNTSFGYYVYGPQIELGFSATSYQPISYTTTQTPLAASPTCNGLLIEEARTNSLLWCRDLTQSPNKNLLKYSQVFTNAVWNSTTGLTGSQQIATGTNPYAICISADGTSVYVVNYGSNTVSIYTRNTSTGALTANGTIATGTNPFSICISYDGTSVYVVNYGSNTVSIYTRNTSTGALTANGTIATGTNPNGICISADGTIVYVANYTSNTVSIYTRNTSTGVLTANGTIATGTNPFGICISADGTSVYVSNLNSNTVSIYNVVTGTMTVTDNSFTAPDSTSTAATLTANANNSITRQSVPTGLGQYTFSVYIYRKTGTGNVDITFDGNTFATQSITGAWVRYSITGYNANNPTMGIRIATSGDSVYVWGAQVEYNTTASTYEVITSQPAIWSKPNSTVALNQIGIDGVSNSASSLTATSTNATALQVVSTAAAAAYASSVYIKGLTVTGVVQVTMDGATWSTVDLSNGLWNRISLSGTVTNPCLGVLIANSGDSVAIDYGQIEAGLGTSSPIYTSSTTVTRAAEISGILPSTFVQFFNANKFTVYAEMDCVFENGTTAVATSVSLGTFNNNYLDIIYWDQRPTVGFGLPRANGLQQQQGVLYKVAVSWQIGNDTSLINSDSGGAINGVLYPVAQNYYNLYPYDRFGIGCTFRNPSSFQQLNGRIKKIIFIPQKLSPSAVLQMTT